MKVAVLDDYFDVIPSLPCYATLKGQDVTVFNRYMSDIDELAEVLKDFEALALFREKTPMRTPLLERLPNLKLISNRSSVGHIDVETCTKLGIVVSSKMGDRAPNYAAAELAVALLLAAARRIPQEAANMKAGKWQLGHGQTLRGKTLGIFGYGRLAELVAHSAAALGMKILVCAREDSRKKAASHGHAVTASKEEMFETADAVSLQLRLVDATRHIVTYDDLMRMKPHSILINTARAGLIAPGALEKALADGRPGYAGIDVYDKEPLTDPNHPLLKAGNVVCVPHIGPNTREEMEAQFSDIFDQIAAFAAGTPTNVVNPDVLDNTR